MESFQYKDIRDRFHYLCEREYTFLSVDRVDNIVCKIFEPDFVHDMLEAGYDLENLVLNGSKLIGSDEIIVPNGIVYSNKYFAGYLMPFFNGVSIYRYSIEPSKLYDIYSRIEGIVRNCDNIVFPDLLTDGNILINDDLDIKLIDFDGMQIGNYSTPVFSRNMGDKSIYCNFKYMDNNLYTKQLDIKSLIYLFINLLLGVEMGYLDQYKGDEQLKQLDEFFRNLHIDDDDLINKICYLYTDDVENAYLGDTAKYICDNYCVELVCENDRCEKRLIRKL